MAQWLADGFIALCNYYRRIKPQVTKSILKSDDLVGPAIQAYPNQQARQRQSHLQPRKTLQQESEQMSSLQNSQQQFGVGTHRIMHTSPIVVSSVQEFGRDNSSEREDKIN